MIVVELKGGLGNQMFQYAAGKALSFHLGCPSKISIRLLQDNFQSISNDDVYKRFYELQMFKNIKDKIVNADELLKFNGNSISNRIYKKLGLSYYKIYHETQSVYTSDFFKLKEPILINGYFQSENYFDKFRHEIRKHFKFSNLKLEDKNQFFLQQIMSTEAISIHVRRGDYLMPVINDIHGLCSKSYYFEAIKLIKTKYPDAVLYFFSDDQKWVKENFDAIYPTSIYIEGNTGANCWKDMYLMSKCNHNIIANSSFSWWAAWLNPNPTKIVIAPKNWFKIKNENYDSTSLLPLSWIKL